MSKQSKRDQGRYKTTLPGLAGFHQTISNRNEQGKPQKAPTHHINAATNGVRNEIQSLLSAAKDSPIVVHIVVTHEYLTDSAGTPLEFQSPGRLISRFSGR